MELNSQQKEPHFLKYKIMNLLWYPKSKIRSLNVICRLLVELQKLDDEGWRMKDGGWGTEETNSGTGMLGHSGHLLTSHSIRLKLPVES